MSDRDETSARPGIRPEDEEFFDELPDYDLGFEYDPSSDDHLGDWLSFGESDREMAVIQYHLRADEPWGEDLRAHASFHTIVENQAAEGWDPTVNALTRLQSEGLDRHQAVHAVAQVLSGVMFDTLHGNISAGDPNAKLASELDKLTAKSWLEQDH